MKKVLESIGVSLSRAVEYVVDKNRKAAQINRLKLVIRNEEKISQKAYVALGKYYYHHLRDENDPVTEPHCNAIDHSSRRLDRAITRLEELCAQPDEQVCADCSSCSSCEEECCFCEDDPCCADCQTDVPDVEDIIENAAEAVQPAEEETAEEPSSSQTEEEPASSQAVDFPFEEPAASDDEEEIPFV